MSLTLVPLVRTPDVEIRTAFLIHLPRIAGDAVVALDRATGEPLPVRRVLLTGLGIGLVVGAACLILPQTTAAVVSGVGATGTAVGVQASRWLTRAARRVGLLN